MSFLRRLKQLFSSEPSEDNGPSKNPRRSDVSGPRSKDLDNLPPERAAELAGHAPERVDT